MTVTGIGKNPYDYYGMQHPKNHNAKQSGTANAVNKASPNYTLHGDSKEYGKVLGGIGFPDGSNASVYKDKEYTTDNPLFLVMTWDAQGNKTETKIDASKVDPANASLQEMMALNANRHLNGEDSFENELMMAAGRLHGDEAASGYDDFFSKNNWISEMEDFMDMQYMLGNMAGYLRYKRVSEIMQSISDTILNIGNSSDKVEDKEGYSKMLEQYAEKMRENIKKGETEPTYQIGRQSFTEKQWKKLLEKMDKDIENIKAEQEERAKKVKEEKIEEEVEKQKRERENIIESNEDADSEKREIMEALIRDLQQDK